MKPIYDMKDQRPGFLGFKSMHSRMQRSQQLEMLLKNQEKRLSFQRLRSINFFCKRYNQNIDMQLNSTVDVAQNAEANPDELFRHQNYSFRRLKEQDRSGALILLSREFADQEPLSAAFLKQFPQDDKEYSYYHWFGIWDTFMDDSISNQMSVVIYDLSNNEEVIGVSTGKDLNYVPEQFQKRYMKDLNFMSAIVGIEEEMINRVKPQYQGLLREKGVVMDIWAVAIKKEHMGKRLLHKMMIANETLGIKQGYQYGFSYACNFKTGIALTKLNYEKISEMESTEFEFMGVKPFSQVQKTQSKPALWLKPLK